MLCILMISFRTMKYFITKPWFIWHIFDNSLINKATFWQFRRIWWILTFILMDFPSIKMCFHECDKDIMYFEKFLGMTIKFDIFQEHLSFTFMNIYGLSCVFRKNFEFWGLLINKATFWKISKDLVYFHKYLTNF